MTVTIINGTCDLENAWEIEELPYSAALIDMQYYLTRYGHVIAVFSSWEALSRYAPRLGAPSEDLPLYALTDCDYLEKTKVPSKRRN